MSIILVTVVMLVNQCKDVENTAEAVATHFTGKEYAGSKTCASCHSQVYEDHLQTAHFSSSKMFDPSNLTSLFESDQNQLSLSDSIDLIMRKRGDRYYQDGFYADSLGDSKPFDITIGSGKRGQTYLYWKEDFLYQLPVSHYTATNSWINSPGYRTDQIDFSRAVKVGCMECHATYLQEKDDFLGKGNRYVKDEVMLGISCEGCHGPGKAHADFHFKNPEEKEPQEMVKYAELTREQRLHSCALCHSGAGTHTKKPFEFMMGGTLDRLSYEKFDPEKAEKLDVHANQYGLLTASQCFIQSPQMDCITCHDVHQDQVNQLEMFSAKCLDCHSKEESIDCGLRSDMGGDLDKNCIDCHMPNMETGNISIFESTAKDVLPTKMRTHLIAIYPNNVDEIKEYIRSNYK